MKHETWCDGNDITVTQMYCCQDFNYLSINLKKSLEDLEPSQINERRGFIGWYKNESCTKSREQVKQNRNPPKRSVSKKNGEQTVKLIRLNTHKHRASRWNTTNDGNARKQRKHWRFTGEVTLQNKKHLKIKHKKKKSEADKKTPAETKHRKRTDLCVTEWKRRPSKITSLFAVWKLKTVPLILICPTHITVERSVSPILKGHWLIVDQQMILWRMSYCSLQNLSGSFSGKHLFSVWVCAYSKLNIQNFTHSHQIYQSGI